MLQKPQDGNQSRPQLSLASGPRSGAGRPALAVVISAYDEPAELARCLDSIAGHDLPVIVSLDSRTTDESAAIAAEHGATVLRHEGLPEVAPETDAAESTKAKNSYARMRGDILNAAEQATNAEWLMWLDADEIVVGGLEKTLEYLPTLPELAVSVVIPMDLHRPDGVIEARLRNSKIIRRGIRFVCRRHEHIQYEPPQQQHIFEGCLLSHLPTQPEEARLRHDARKTQLEPYYEDWREFGTGRAAFYIADWHRMMQGSEDALRWYEKGLALPDSHCTPPQRAMLAMFAGRVWMEQALQQTNKDRQMEYAIQAHACFYTGLRHDWKYTEAFYFLGKVATMCGQVDEAEHWFNIALSLKEEQGAIMQQEHGCCTYLPYYGLAACARLRGNRDLAYELLHKAESMAAPLARMEFEHLRKKLDEDVSGEGVDGLRHAHTA